MKLIITAQFEKQLYKLPKESANNIYKKLARLKKSLLILM